MNDLEHQSRLKTTIHLLVVENATLKKQLSCITKQSEEQTEEIERLKRKINHLVVKIDNLSSGKD